MKIFNTFLGLAIGCLFFLTANQVSASGNIVLGTITPHTYCPGDSIMIPFTITGNFTGANVFKAVLSNDTGQFRPGTVIGTFTSTVAGTIHAMIPLAAVPNLRYRIKVKSTSPIDSSAVSVDSFTVYGNNFIPNIAAIGPTTICSNDSVVMWNVTGGPYSAYQWYRNNIAITGATASHYTATLAGSYTLQLTTPCASFTTNNPIYVTVNQAPNMTLTGDTLICINDVGTMVATGAYTYLWSPSNTLNQSNTSTVVAHPTVHTTYTVTGTNLNGCTATMTHSISVNPLPIVHAFTAHDTICLGANVLLTATGCDLYSWSPSQYLNTFLGDSVIATPPNSMWFRVNGKNNACTPTATDSVYITVIQGANVTVTGNDTICQGLSTTLTANGATSYNWSPGISLNDSTLATVIASPTATTLYHITGHQGGCNGIDSFKVTVKPAPNITITGRDTICGGSSTTLTASGAVNFIWSPFIGLVDTVSAAEVANPTSTTTYTVRGLGANGCLGQNTFTLVIVDCSGIYEVSNDNNISVFPNPATTSIEVACNVHGENVTSISIINAKGSTIYSQSINKVTSDKTKIDLSNQAKGVYILQIKTDKSIYTKKIAIK